jgi:hypothetical protein
MELALAGESGPEEFSFQRAGQRGGRLGATIHQTNHFHQVVMDGITRLRLRDRMDRKLVR